MMNQENLWERVGHFGENLRHRIVGSDQKPVVLDESPMRDAIKMMTEKPIEPSETYIE